MLAQAIRTARMTAMKERNTVAKTVLTTLLGELEGKAKRDGIEISDDMVISTCKKFISSNLEVIHNGGCLDTLETENAILDGYIPKQLTEEEMYAIITALMPSNLGDIMQHLKNNYQGLYNGKMASNVARHIIG